MTTLLVKFVALASTFMLLLPAGWCQGWDCCQTKTARATASEQAAAPVSLAEMQHRPATNHSCCQKPASATQKSAASKVVEYVRFTSPAHSTADCCCTRGKLVTVKITVSAPDELSVSPLTSIAPVMAMVCDQLPVAVAVDSPCTSGPPVRILHCVWRC